jgi:lysophospholipase L1-like esterase
VIWVGVNSNTTRWHLDTWGAWFNAWVRYYAKFADWAAYARGHQDWFLLDGVHLSSEGNAQYAKLIVDTVVEQCR